MRTVAVSLALVLGARGLPGQEPEGCGPGQQRLYLSFLGDIMVHTVNYLTPDYGEIYRSLRPILLRDTLSFANLEAPADPTRPHSGYPRFNASREYLQAAVDAGVDVFSLANNHAFDQDLAGIGQTLRCLDEVGRRAFRRIYYEGVREFLEGPFDPIVIRAKGLCIGFLAVTQMVNWPMPGPYVHIVDYANPRHREYFLSYIQSVAREYDLFILSYHGGREYAAEPEEGKVRFFRDLLAAGVDIVYGHHPHVLQRYELVERTEGRGLMLCSTGNLISGMTWSLDPEHPEDPLSWTGDSALWLVVVRAGNGRAEIEQVTPLPISNYRDRQGVTAVLTFGSLAGAGLPEPWLRYYRQRHANLRSLFRQWAAARSDP